MSVSKNKIKKIGHLVCVGDMMSQTYPIYACCGANHALHFIGSRHVMRQLEARVFKPTLGKNLLGKSLERMEQFDIQFVEKSRSFKQNRLEHFPRVVHNL